MTEFLRKIEKIVGKVECGKNEGNAILIDDSRAITVKHCVDGAIHTGEKIWIYGLPENEGEKIEATIDEQFNQEQEEIVLLNLHQPFLVPNVKFGATILNPFVEASVWGYDANFRVQGKWTRLVSTGSVNNKPELIQDMLFECINGGEKNFEGLSGSPIMSDDYIVGIVSQETLVDNDAISLHGISVKKCTAFFDKYKIPYEEIKNSETKYSGAGPTSCSLSENTTKISVAGEQEVRENMIKGLFGEKLCMISDLHKKGDMCGAWKELKATIQRIANDKSVNEEIIAEYYLKMAIWYVDDYGDLGKAQQKFDKAFSLNPNIDGSVFKALKKAKSNKNTFAEDELLPIDSTYKLNVYLQICLNARRAEKANIGFQDVEDEIESDSTTFYLRCIMNILLKKYDEAQSNIDEAIKIESAIPIYYLMKGIIFFWKAVPKDICLSEDLYPVIFTNGILHLDAASVEMITQGSKYCRQAYELAKYLDNAELIEMILSVWICILSVDVQHQKEIMEPLNLIKEYNPFNVTLLLYSILYNLDLDSAITCDNLEKRIKKGNNKVAYIIVLLELCLRSNEKGKAKKYLHEYKSVLQQDEYIQYWYEYITKADESLEQLEESEKSIIENDKLDLLEKKRLLCLVIQNNCERDEELEIHLKELYETTGNRLDLINIISFCQKNRKWNELKKYSNDLIEKYKDMVGHLYHIQALIELEEYEEAENEIEEVKKDSYINVTKELMYFSMLVYERKGDYDKAIDAGESICRIKASASLRVRLSRLYASSGDEEMSINSLLKVEEEGNLTVEVCQHLALLYLVHDRKRAWHYAKKAVDLSEEQPEVMLWATEIANRVGKSDRAAFYYHTIFSKHPNHQMMQMKSIDEIIELLDISRQEEVENIQKLQEGKISAYMYLDQKRNGLTYAEWFYNQLDAKTFIPLIYGAHFFEEEILTKELKQIALDYSTCLLLYEMGILDDLAAHVNKIYLAGELFGIILEELRKILTNQPDILEKRKKLLDKCREKKIESAECNYTENLIDLPVQEKLEMINTLTANSCNAEYVCGNDEDYGIRLCEVLCALYKEGQIEENTYKSFEFSHEGVRDEKVEFIIESHPNMLLGQTELQFIVDNYLLDTIMETYHIFVEKVMIDEIEFEIDRHEQNKRIYSRLESLKNELIELKEQDKISFFPISHERDKAPYTNMLISLLSASEKRNIPICVDDRLMTSYPRVGDSPIFCTFDILKILLKCKKITKERYCELVQKMYDLKVQYVLPDSDYVMQAFKLSSYDKKTNELVESDMLMQIRKIVAVAFSEYSFMSHETNTKLVMPEWESFLFHLQGNSRVIIRKIWESSMDDAKKYEASQWMIYHYSQFAFDFGTNVLEKERKNMQAIQMADFFLIGMLLPIEQDVERYYNWLYSWGKTYLASNNDIKGKAIAYLKEFIVSHLKQCRKQDGKELQIVYQLLSIGLHHLPEEYKAEIMREKDIADFYDSQYSVLSVVLDGNTHIPVSKFKEWENDVIRLPENEIMTKKYNNIEYTISWINIIPTFPGIIVKWDAEMEGKERRVFLDRRIQLLHKDKKIRKGAIESIKKYLPEGVIKEKSIELINRTGCEKTADELLAMLEESWDFQETKIRYCFLHDIFFEENSYHLCMPQTTYIFKEIYDCYLMDDIESGDSLDEKYVGVPICLKKQMENIDCSNNNPVRCLRRLYQMYYNDFSEDEIQKRIMKMFEFLENKTSDYGKIFSICLKQVWRILNGNEVYLKEPKENRIVWSYLWTDFLMSCHEKMKADGQITIADLSARLEYNERKYVDDDDYSNNEFAMDIIEPRAMNLVRLCVVGSCIALYDFQRKYPRTVGIFLMKVAENIPVWRNNLTYYKELELPHEGTENVLKSIFNQDLYSLIGKFDIFTNANTKNARSDNIEISLNVRIESQLAKIKELETISLNELAYLLVLARAEISEGQINTIVELIEEKVMEKPVVVNLQYYNALTALVHECPDVFKENFLKHENNRIMKLLCGDSENWRMYCEIIQWLATLGNPEQYILFWEEYATKMRGLVPVPLIDMVAWLQVSLPYEYSERVRQLRIELELKE